LTVRLDWKRYPRNENPLHVQYAVCLDGYEASLIYAHGPNIIVPQWVLGVTGPLGVLAVASIEAPADKPPFDAAEDELEVFVRRLAALCGMRIAEGGGK
jgi:hypothetical protein